MGPPVTHFIGTRTTIHYANLAAEAGGNRSGFDLLVGALTRRYAAQGLAATQAHRRPSWQHGPGAFAGPDRALPDVAFDADPPLRCGGAAARDVAGQRRHEPGRPVLGRALGTGGAAASGP